MYSFLIFSANRFYELFLPELMQAKIISTKNSIYESTKSE